MNQEIVIGSGDNEIRVVVRKGDGDRVKLAISAPEGMPIKRGELAPPTKKGMLNEKD